MNVSLCIATYRRPDRLALLLDDLAAQTRPPDELVIVDNDPDASAEAVVAARLAIGLPFPVRYDRQPVKNISLTRNHSVALAGGDWIAFIDDDERAPAAWLDQLCSAVRDHAADGVLGPVVPVLPANAPAWIRRGRFYDWTRLRSGQPVPPNRLRFGNLILRASLLHGPAPFDPAYGLTGGEDGDLLTRLAQSGAHLVWCDEAVVHEPVESARLTLGWLLRRALRGGQDFARHTLAGRYGSNSLGARARLVLRAAAQLLAATLLTPLSLPFGRHHAVHWMTKASANLGKLTVFWGWHYREYA
ncbi:glycosyltransferase family 2 protein [Luteimonas terrae]|uniref:Succinoglycan biosynthesis protein ExoM n=1 Tax=Luteimonas terrae TaxID=1530191 RepID=A0ABU1XYA1_9GAMM|nr:glycosyltransferase [Luteimonas terrae]MDR7193728.1 succinoglycan biosynthesis protein ExoM [Luteimonas terrae]